jgi:galactokinase
MSGFESVFGRVPEAVAQAPGRVNLLGEHTDGNGGFVLPIAIAQHTRVAMARSDAAGIALHARELGSTVRFVLEDAPAEHFASYVYGCLRLAQELGAPVNGLQIHVASDVPMGVGLSSSAALEVATLRCLRLLYGLAMDDVQVAQLAHRAEVEFAGVNCGIMDQMAASLADTQRALLLDTRSLKRRVVELPTGTAVLVIDSGVPRSLAASGYDQRRAECEEASQRLGVKSLRDVGGVAALEVLPDLLKKRARHVVTENARVLAAANCRDASEFGTLMNASHASLRDDYEVSTPEVDRLVALLQAQPHVHGARLTGAGFGGACVALCRSGSEAEVGQAVLAQYGVAGQRGTVLVPPA